MLLYDSIVIFVFSSEINYIPVYKATISATPNTFVCIMQLTFVILHRS